MLFLKSFNLKSYRWTQDATTDFCKYYIFKFNATPKSQDENKYFKNK